MITTEDNRIEELKQYIDKYRERDHFDSYLIAILHKAQDLYGYLSKEAMDFISEEMSIPTSHIWGVATFYHYFNLKPVGKYMISVCMGTACYVKGANDILKTIKKELKIGVGETTEDNMFTLNEARCLGACGLSPVMMVGEKIYGKLTPDKTIQILKQYLEKG